MPQESDGRRMLHPDLTFKVMVWALGTIGVLLAVGIGYAGKQFESLVGKVDTLSTNVQALATISAESAVERRYVLEELSRNSNAIEQVDTTLRQHMLNDAKVVATQWRRIEVKERNND